MKRIILKRLIITTITSFLVVFAFINILSLLPNQDVEQNKPQSALFNNGFFDTDLNISDSPNQTVTFATLQSIIVTQMNRSVDPNIKDLDMKSALQTAIAGRKIAIGSAEDLYNFSTSVSYNWIYPGDSVRVPMIQTIQFMLDQDYVLVSDIDYLSYRSRKFNPIGIDFFTDFDIDSYTEGYQAPRLPFTGSFDGQGFTISNLYMADFDYIKARISQSGYDEDFSTTRVYAMFSNIGSGAVVKNVIIKNPNFELLDAPAELTKAANFVGINNGTIYNVAVIDDKKNVTGNSISGIRFNMIYVPAFTSFEAAGFAHTNGSTGKIYNSYFISDNVVSTAANQRFNVRPFVYTYNAVNSGLDGVAYDSMVLPNVDSTVQPSTVKSYESNEFITGIATLDSLPIVINKIDLETLYQETIDWEFYPDDGYPILFKLNYNSSTNQVELRTPYDVMAFNALFSYATKKFNSKYFSDLNYKLMNSIDMKNITGYRTPTKEFTGIFRGNINTDTLYNDDFSTSSINNNYYLYNLTITKPAVVENNYYLGLFSKLTGSVRNINLYNNKLTLTDSDDFYGRIFYIGAIAGMSEGVIRNVVSDTDIDLGTQAIGKSYVGGLAGQANNTIAYSANLGNINGNNHNFNNKTIDATYYMGGILGATNDINMTLIRSINKGDINGVGSSNLNYNVSSGAIVQNHLGGIVGYVENTIGSSHSFFYLTNDGKISVGNFPGYGTINVVQYMGGIFGEVKGNAFDLMQTSTTFKNGRWVNNGITEINHIYNNNTVNSAGIAVVSTTPSKAHFSYMINNGSFSIPGLTYLNHNTNIFYSATVLDNTTSGIKLSRAYNTAPYTFRPTYFNVTTTDTAPIIQIAPFFVSKNNNETELLYVENKGEILVGSTTSTVSNVYRELEVAGITLTNKVNYQTVINSGNIRLLRLNNSKEIWVSGISKRLSYKESTNTPYLMRNVVNKGTISTADIKGNTVVSVANDPNTLYSTDIINLNLYVGGLVNINSGSMTNVFNSGDITSSDTSGIENITGTANTYVGGIATFNYNLIQDAGNTGNINYTNSTSSIPLVAGTTDQFGGMLYGFMGGLTLGGIVAAFGDDAALILTGNGKDKGFVANLLDSANKGDVFGKANNYVRSAGVLAVALGTELTAGTDEATSNTVVRRFATNATGANDRVAQSTLSNGLNFGNIYAVTSLRANYTSVNQRLGVYASAGGVIAYGLCRLTRMLNHGKVVSNDVAGGIIGATYIFGTDDTNSSTKPMPVTDVSIDTAVHYGQVEAYVQTRFSSINYLTKDTIDNYYSSTSSPTRTSFLFGTSTSITSISMGIKPGYGGIFGRLQRGTYGVMQSSTFKNILNMDPNIDMIGRADQTTYGSFFFYRFGQLGVQDTFYSARTNDKSTAVIIGFNETVYRYVTTNNRGSTARIRRDKMADGTYSYIVIDIRMNAVVNRYSDTTRIVGRYLPKSYYGYDDLQYDYLYTPVTPGTSATSYDLNQSVLGLHSTLTSIRYDYSALGISDSAVLTAFGSSTANRVEANVTFYNNFEITLRRTSTTRTAYAFPKVQDTNSTSNSPLYIFRDASPQFPLMNPTQANYIYQAKKEVLPLTFQSARPNGMYVLASSKGRDAGAVLPLNININPFYGLKETDEPVYYDLDNIKNDNLNVPARASLSTDPFYIKYSGMFQIVKSDKSSILPKDTQPTIGDLVLYNKDNPNMPILEGGVINNSTKTITYTVSQSAFPTGGNYTFHAKSATLSENAVIAKNGIVKAEQPNFTNAYLERTSNIITDPNFIFSYTGAFNASNTIEFQMTVYSEAAADDTTGNLTIMSDYKSIYTIRIIKELVDLNVEINQIKVNNSTLQSPHNLENLPPPDNLSYTIPSGSAVSPNGTIDVRFREITTYLPIDHLITIYGLTKDGDTVSTDYYNLIRTPLYIDGSNRYFGFSLTLSDKLESGVYKLEFSYYNSSTRIKLIFTKAPSTERLINNVSYTSFSSDANGSNFQFTPTGTNFTTYIEFGEIFEGVLTTPRNLTVTSVPNGIVSNYLNLVDSYDLKLDDQVILSLYISPFATITNASVYYQYDAFGIKSYIFNYTINNGGQSTPLTHTIRERALSDKWIYKDGNRDFNNPVLVTREALLTRITVDFKLLDNSLYSQISTVITKNGLAYTPVANQITIHNNLTYEIEISYLLEVGIKRFSFTLTREPGVLYSLGYIDIEKVLGVSAYMTDISFQINSDFRLSYPLIYVINSDGSTEANSDYDPRIYFDGIDYNRADIVGKRYFRIDGVVSDIILTDYHPLFSLPLGAIIQRQVSPGVWTNDLYGNFTSEIDDELTVIRYRVLSEKTNSLYPGVLTDITTDPTIVYYDITVNDILYKLTLRFEIFFRTAGGDIMPANHVNSPIKNSAVLILTKHYTTNELFSGTVQTEPSGKITYPYEGEVIGYTGELNSQSTLFYFPFDTTTVPNYLYTFARNETGIYNFAVVTPKHTGLPGTNLVVGLRYSYNIYLKTGSTGGTIYPWNSDNFKLPVFDSTGSIQGKYYYVTTNSRQIVREFVIVIEENTIGSQWGLYDDYTSWDN